jgi:hypothetical protein
VGALELTPFLISFLIVLGDGKRSLRVSIPEDIVAEKLRAFLQQKETIRNRERPQDLLDIAHSSSVTRP